VYHCGGGVTSFAIDPQGGLSICVLSQREKSTAERIAARRLGRARCCAVRQRKITGADQVPRCAKLKFDVRDVPANGELENGDPEAPVDFLCRVAHMRAYAFDLRWRRRIVRVTAKAARYDER